MKAIVVIQFLLTGTLALAAGWREANNGLPSASIGVKQLVVHAATRDIYALTANGIFKSTDGAERWTTLTTMTGALTPDPNDPSTIYVINLTGLMKSADGGTTWVSTGPPGQPLGSLAINPADSATLYVTSADPQGHPLIFKSADAGVNWDALNPGLPQGVGFSGPPIFVPGNPAKIYVPYGGLVNNSFIAGLATTSNRGQTWATVPIPTRFTGVSGMFSLAIDPSRESVIYAVVSTSGSNPGYEILKSTDEGKSWSALQNGLPSNSSYGPLAIDSAAPSIIYAPYTGSGCGGCGGIVKTTDGGAHWTIIKRSLTEGEGYTFALDGSTIYAALFHYSGPGGGIIKSTDGGASWIGTAAPTVIDVHAMAVNPLNSAIIYASAGDTVFQSVDYGENWAQLAVFQIPAISPYGSGPAIARALSVDFVNPNILYARTGPYNGCYYLENFLFKSTDGGASWSDSISPPASGCLLYLDPPWMVMDPVDPSTLYLGENDFSGNVALLKTTDGGATWRNIWDSLVIMQGDFPDPVYALAIDPARTTTLYAGLGGAYTGGLFRSTNGGDTWSSIGLDGSGIPVLAIDPADSSVIYAGTAGVYDQPRGFRGMFKSTDAGATWSSINQGLDSLLQGHFPVTGLIVDPADSNILYLATSGAGVFRTIDSGAIWTGFNDGLANLDVRALALASGTLYAGTGAGVFAIDSAAPK